VLKSFLQEIKQNGMKNERIMICLKGIYNNLLNILIPRILHEVRVGSHFGQRNWIKLLEGFPGGLYNRQYIICQVKSFQIQPAMTPFGKELYSSFLEDGFH